MIEWTVEKRKLSELKELPNNPRKISKEAFDALKKRLRERGFHDILKIDKDNFVLSGNQRFKAMMEEWGGDYEVDVKVPSEKLSESDRKKVILESNHNDGEYDLDILAQEFESELDSINMGYLNEIDIPSYSDENKEININDIKKDLKYKCPKCGFEFQKHKVSKE